MVVILLTCFCLDPEKQSQECQCDYCQKKKLILQTNEPWKWGKELFT